MFGAGGAIKMIAMLMIVCIVAGGLYYVSNLQANLAMSSMKLSRIKPKTQTHLKIVSQKVLMDNLETSAN